MAPFPLNDQQWIQRVNIQSQRFNTFLFHSFYHLRYLQNLQSLNHVSVGFPITFMQQTDYGSNTSTYISFLYAFQMSSSHCSMESWEGYRAEGGSQLSRCSIARRSIARAAYGWSGCCCCSSPGLLPAGHGAPATLPVLSVHSDRSPKYVTWSSYIGT